MYVLITYYNRGTAENPIWDVYGHVAPGENHALGEFKTEGEAQKRAFEYCLPVMRGANHGKISLVLEKLK